MDAHAELVVQQEAAVVPMVPVAAAEVSKASANLPTKVIPLTIADLADLIQVSLSMTTTIKVDESYSITSSDVTVYTEDLKVITKVPDVIRYHHDIHNRFTVYEFIQRSKFTATSYTVWLQEFLDVVQNEAESLKVAYKLDERVYSEGYCMFPLDLLGVESNLNESRHPDIHNVRRGLFNKCAPVSRNHKFEDVYIGSHPQRSELIQNSQNILFDSHVDVNKNWVRNFVLRKKLITEHGYADRNTNPDIQWFNSASPSSLSRLIGVFPNTNLIRVMNCAAFLLPEMEMGVHSIGSLAVSSEISITKTNPLIPLLTGSPSAANRKDYQKIIASLVMPNQILLDIKIDINEPPVLLAAQTLIAKLLFSNSRACRNLHPSSVNDMDELLRNYSQTIGAAMYPRCNYVWDAITGHEDGSGWVNHGVDATRLIDDPLYEGVNELPMYGGMENPLAFDAYAVGGNPTAYASNAYAVKRLAILF